MSQNYSMFSSHLASHLPRLARWVESLGGLATFSLNSIWPNLLCRHFARAGLRPDLYMVDWVSHLLVSSLSRFLWSLFSGDDFVQQSCASWHYLSHLGPAYQVSFWRKGCMMKQNIFRDGEGFLFRAALGVLSLYQDQMLKETDFVLMAQFLTKLPENMESDALFARIDGITLEHLQM